MNIVAIAICEYIRSHNHAAVVSGNKIYIYRFTYYDARDLIVVIRLVEDCVMISYSHNAFGSAIPCTYEYSSIEVANPNLLDKLIDLIVRIKQDKWR